MEYILFIHKNTASPIPKEQWDSFFSAALESNIFKGGSEISNRIQLGEKPVNDITENVGGFMRFESEDIETVKSLLNKHPVLINGGTLELCETPKTEA